MTGNNQKEVDLPAPGKDTVGWVSPSYTHSREARLYPKVLAYNRCVAFFPNLPEVECYRVLRSQILPRTLGKGGNTLMVTSALPGEGKTLTAINLAFTFAREFKNTVLLVDCDLRQQSIHRVLGIAGEKGLVDYILDDCPVEDLIVWPGVEKMTVLSGGRTIQGSSELLGSPRMKDLVADMKSRYQDRYIIFDVPPVLSTADALAFAPWVDHVVMVVQAGKTPLPDVKRTLGLLPREKILGVVLNRDEGTEENYYYKYYKEADKKKEPSDRQNRSSVLRERKRNSPGIFQEIGAGDLINWGKEKLGKTLSRKTFPKTGIESFLSWGKEKIKKNLPRKILLGSILALAVLAAVAYYFSWYEIDWLRSGEKKYPLPTGRLTGQEKPSPEESNLIPPRRLQKEGEEGSPASLSAPPVSSDPPSSEEKSQVPSAVPPKETPAVKARDGENPGKDKRIAKEPSPPEKIDPPPNKDFFAIKIMAVHNPQIAQDFLDSQKKRGFDIHSRTIKTKNGGLWHQIFWGHFGSQEEARRFFDQKEIRQSYPGSVIVKLIR